jgi:uncharacterized protein (UPF0218 family)
MTVEYRISEQMRARFKEPFGFLIQGDPKDTMNKLREIIKQEKPTKLIAVGDIVSRNLYNHNIDTNIVITDNQSLREKVESIIYPGKKLVLAKNPQGTITKEAIIAIQDSLKDDKSVQILIEGEEDLLTLIAVLHAPKGAIIVYGQPNQGIVVVKVTSEKKNKASTTLEKMKV